MNMQHVYWGTIMLALGTVFMVVVAVAIFAGILVGIEKSECRQWADKASIADWQREQCEHYNLPLTGKVRPETIR